LSCGTIVQAMMDRGDVQRQRGVRLERGPGLWAPAGSSPGHKISTSGQVLDQRVRGRQPQRRGRPITFVAGDTAATPPGATGGRRGNPFRFRGKATGNQVSAENRGPPSVRWGPRGTCRGRGAAPRTAAFYPGGGRRFWMPVVSGPTGRGGVNPDRENVWLTRGQQAQASDGVGGGRRRPIFSLRQRDGRGLGRHRANARWGPGAFTFTRRSGLTFGHLP